MSIKVNSFAILGGDKRQAEIANYLFKLGYKIYTCGLENSEGLNSNIIKFNCVSKTVISGDCILLPMPVSENCKTIFSPLSNKEIYLDEIFEDIKPLQPVIGGRISSDVDKFASDRKIKLIDYYSKNELKIKNAVTTAEGALAVAIENTDISIFESNCLVCGFGRIGKHLSQKLKALGANVTVSARSLDDFAYIKALGYETVHTYNLQHCIRNADIIFNTVPALIINESLIKEINSDSLIIDLASVPGGVDFKAAEDKGIKTIHALSLPSKYSPKTAAKHICETIIKILEELE